MSADNGVYILSTPKGSRREYRVAHQMGVDNYRWDENSLESPYRKPGKETTGWYSDDPDVHIKNAREMWKGAPLFTDEEEAVNHAYKVMRGLEVCEYGVSTVEIEREF